jgi:chemotaxis protein MotA
VSTSQAFAGELPKLQRASLGEPARHRQIDLWMLAGIAIALMAVVLGIASTGVTFTYFFHPTGALIVLGGTLGVIFITTPGTALLYSARRLAELFWSPVLNREELAAEMVAYSRIVRTKGLLAIEPLIPQASNQFLEELLILALDVNQRAELQAALESKLRLTERQGEADAKVFEVAGGFAPTIGVIGTVVGLIDVLRKFSDVSSVAYGIGTAFVSTIYGLALANLVLLPAAHRIRARVAELFEVQELMIEGGLCIYDRMSPSLVRQRLSCFLRGTRPRMNAAQNATGRQRAGSAARR